MAIPREGIMPIPVGVEGAIVTGVMTESVE